MQVHIDSTYRDRTLYPLATDFVVPPKQNYYGDEIEYKNPVAILFPNVHSGVGLIDPGALVIVGGNYSTVIGFPDFGAFVATSAQQNLFGNCYFLVRHAFGNYEVAPIGQCILNYPAANQTSLLFSSPLTVPSAAGDRWAIYRNLPYHYGNFQPGSTSNHLKLDITAPSNDGELVGMWIMITDMEFPPSADILGQCSRIIAYDGVTKTATVSPPFASAPSAFVFYEVYKVIYESAGSLWYANGLKDPYATQPRYCSLTSLIMPNTILIQGGSIDNFPYLIVTIANEGFSATSSTSITTNNFNEYKATYIVPMYLQLNTQRFFVLSPSIKKKFLIDFNRPIRVSVLSPDGNPLIWSADNIWISNYFPWFSQNIPAVPPFISAVRYPGISPDTPPPFEAFSYLQMSVILDVEC